MKYPLMAMAVNNIPFYENPRPLTHTLHGQLVGEVNQFFLARQLTFLQFLCTSIHSFLKYPAEGQTGRWSGAETQTLPSSVGRGNKSYNTRETATISKPQGFPSVCLAWTYIFVCVYGAKEAAGSPHSQH